MDSQGGVDTLAGSRRQSDMASDPPHREASLCGNSQEKHRLWIVRGGVDTLAGSRRQSDMASDPPP